MVMPSGMTVFVQPKISSFGLVLMSALHSPPRLSKKRFRASTEMSQKTYLRLIIVWSRLS